MGILNIDSSLLMLDGSILKGDSPFGPQPVGEGYWPFDADASDYSGYGNNFQLLSIFSIWPKYLPGKINNCAELQYLGTSFGSLKAPGISISGTNPWSTTFWFKDPSISPSSGPFPWQGYVVQSSYTNTSSTIFRISNGVTFDIFRIGGGYSQTIYSEERSNGWNNWNYIAYTFDGSVHNLWIDNDHLVINLDNSIGPQAGNGLVVGGEPWRWFGYLDGLRYFNTAIDAGKVSYIWNNGIGR